MPHSESRASDTRPTANRTDIQALRGLAVVLVIAYHAKREWFAAGYLGVDIFFVISGYLITRLVSSGISRGDFSLPQFYFRRAKRLLPAAYVTFVATLAAAPWFLGTAELREFIVQLVGAVTFTSNIVLWQQSGYFDSAAELKPLLHVWSLSLEEQYYLLLPATLLIVPTRYWLRVAVTVLLVSLVLWCLGSQTKPIASFFLLPTRAWELALGSVGALLSRTDFVHRRSDKLLAASLIALVVVPFVPAGEVLAMLGLPIVCVSTLVVLLRAHPLLMQSLPVRILAPVGDFSYSLYLVHWPLFAFANNAWVGNPAGRLPIAVTLLLVALTFVGGYTLYRFVERPLHQAPIRLSTRSASGFLLASLALLSVPAVFLRGDSAAGTADVQRSNGGFAASCEYDSQFTAKPECSDSSRPKIIVWGDSLAMHLVSGIVQSAGSDGVIQATRSLCGPLVDVAPLREGSGRGLSTLNRVWADSCISFNQSVIEYLARTDSVQVVVLASLFEQFLDPENRTLRRTRDGAEMSDASVDSAVAAMGRTVDAIRSVGKRVVVVAPPPSGTFNIGSCLERHAERKLVFGATPDCTIRRDDFLAHQRRVLEFVGRLPQEADVAVFRFDTFLCNEATCETSTGGTWLYRDSVHLSYAGSRLLGERLELATSLARLAR